jgi:hypothetical protein
MIREQTPRHWIGSDVLLKTIRHLEALTFQEARRATKYGTLQDVSEEGVVLLEKETISWRGPDHDPEEETGRGREDRQVYQFYPWHIIFSLRPQEEEEKRDQELYR